MAAAVGNTKRCPKCEQTKELDQFTADKRRKDGLKVHCRACRTADARKRYRSDPERHAAAQRQHRTENRDAINAAQRAYIAGRRPQRKACYDAWVAENPERKRAYDHDRRARAVGAEGSYEADDIAAIRIAQRNRCAYCGRKLDTAKSIKRRGEIDHIHPLVKGGTNNARNLQLACRSCNASKGSKDPLDFARQIGRLL